MKYILLIFTLLLASCSTKNYDTTETKIITIRSPKLKFSDIGYVRISDKKMELELFIAGKSIQKFTLNHLICTSNGCISKNAFNEEYLNKNYPSEILQNILLKHQIYDGKNIQKKDGGFEQFIVDDNVEITYRVDSHGVYFRDTKNSIIFQIKDLTNEH